MNTGASPVHDSSLVDVDYLVSSWSINVSTPVRDGTSKRDANKSGTLLGPEGSGN